MKLVSYRCLGRKLSLRRISLWVSCGVMGMSKIYLLGSFTDYFSIVNPHPPMLRALKTAKQSLQAAGVKVIDWEPYKSLEILQLIITLFFPDGGKAIMDLINLSGEPLNAEAGTFFQHAKEISVTENWACNAKRDQLRAEFHALMKKRGVDIILCPPFVSCAPLMGKMDYGTYTMLWNLLDQPALVYPSGLFVSESLDPVDVEYKPTNPMDQVQHDKCESLQSCQAVDTNSIGRRSEGLFWCSNWIASCWQTSTRRRDGGSCKNDRGFYAWKHGMIV